MTRTIWLASYPKSGNTWFRFLIANLSASEPLGVNDLPRQHTIASAREPFDQIMLIDSGLLTHDEVDCLRPRLYEEMARDPVIGGFDEPGQAAEPMRFVKVHDAYVVTPQAEPLLAGRRGADGVILLVRDPRDVAPSLAGHIGKGIDEAIVMMNDWGAALCATPDRLDRQLRQRLLSWSGHVASWLDQRHLPVHVVRYEDLTADTAGTFAAALAFAGHTASAADVQRAVGFTDFARLRQQEQAQGFREAPERSPRPFFRLGQAGAWRRALTAAQVARIEAAHAPTMHRLGYVPVSDTRLASTA